MNDFQPRRDDRIVPRLIEMAGKQVLKLGCSLTRFRFKMVSPPGLAAVTVALPLHLRFETHYVSGRRLMG